MTWFDDAKEFVNMFATNQNTNAGAARWTSVPSSSVSTFVIDDDAKFFLETLNGLESTVKARCEAFRSVGARTRHSTAYADLLRIQRINWTTPKSSADVAWVAEKLKEYESEEDNVKA